MRKFIGLAAIVILAGFPFAALAGSYPGSAPADEYFGPHRQSILEIKNRLDHLDQKTSRELIDSNAVVEIDDIAASVSDWHAQYPQDPWLPHTYARLLREYERVGQSTSDRAVACFGEMQQAYPDSPDTADVAMIYGAAATQNVAVAPALPQPPPPMPVAVQTAALPVPVMPSYASPGYAPIQNAGAWARFSSMRGGVYYQAQAAPPMAQPAYYQAPPKPATTVTVNVTVNGQPQQP
jgi:hypothetical protein